VLTSQTNGLAISDVPVFAATPALDHQALC